MAVPLPNTTALAAAEDISVTAPSSGDTSRASPEPGNGTVTPPVRRGPGNLRQRFRTMTEDMGKSMEDLVVRLRPSKVCLGGVVTDGQQGDGNFKVLGGCLEVWN